MRRTSSPPPSALTGQGGRPVRFLEVGNSETYTGSTNDLRRRFNYRELLAFGFSRKLPQGSKVCLGWIPSSADLYALSSAFTV